MQQQHTDAKPEETSAPSDAEAARPGAETPAPPGAEISATAEATPDAAEGGRQLAAEIAPTTDPAAGAPSPRAFRRRTILGAWKDDLDAAAAPIAALVFYGITLFVPDQSAEAFRTMFEYRTGWLVLALIGWLIFLLYFNSALVCSAAGGFKKRDRLVGARRGEQFFRSSSRRTIIMWLLAVLPVLVTVGFMVKGYSSDLSHQGFLFGFGASYLAVGLFWATDLMAEGTKNGFTQIHRVPTEHLFQVLTILGSIALLVGVGLGREPPPTLTIVVWIIIVLAILQLFEWISFRYGLPALTILAVWVAILSIFDGNDNHAVATLATTSTEQTPDIETAFQKWIDARKPQIAAYAAAGRRYPVFIMVAEGGGLRATSMTAQVFDQLLWSCPDAMRHTFLSIGVSGGSVGAMLASATMKQDGLKTGCSGDLGKPGEASTQATKVADEDLLKSVLRGMLFTDIPAQVLPASIWPVSGITPLTDRARYLEAGIATAWQRNAKPDTTTAVDLATAPFESLWEGPDGSIPALMLLATDVNTGRRIAVSHVKMRKDMTKNQVCNELSNPDPAMDADERARVIALAELSDEDLLATTAAVISARFPGITPAATIRCPDAKRRLVDGGYFENSGLTTALDVAKELLPTVAQNNLSLHVVTIENGAVSTPELAKSYFSELLSPFRAMEGTRSAHADLARVYFQQLLSTQPYDCGKQQRCLGWVRFQLKPCGVEVPLGWSLSSIANREISKQLRGTNAKCSTRASYDEIFALAKPLQ